MESDKIIGTSPAQAMALIRESYGYDVDSHGIIRSPGKFESEAWYAPMVHEWMLEGDFGAHELSDGTILYELHAIERETFDLEPEYVGISLYVSDQGFVNVEPRTQREWDSFIAEDAEEITHCPDCGFVYPNEDAICQRCES